jgi:hypothetical protein
MPLCYIITIVNPNNKERAMTDETNTPNPFEDDEFLDDLLGEFPEEEQFSPEEVVTIVSTGGGTHYIPTEEAAPINELLARADLNVSPSIEYWVEGNVVTPDYVVGPGAQVTAVGVVKGG